MFDSEGAKEKLTELLNADYHVHDDELVVVPEETIEKDYGWIFFYDSKRYLKTGQFSHSLAGNGPVVFEKENGVIHHLGSHAPPQKLIKEFEAKNRK